MEELLDMALPTPGRELIVGDVVVGMEETASVTDVLKLFLTFL